MRPVAGGFVLEADAGDGMSDVFAGLGRHQGGLLDSTHRRGNVTRQNTLNYDSLAGVLDPQVLCELVHVRLKYEAQFLAKIHLWE